MKVWVYDALADSEPDGNSEWVSLPDYLDLRMELDKIYNLACGVPILGTSEKAAALVRFIDNSMKHLPLMERVRK